MATHGIFSFEVPCFRHKTRWHHANLCKFGITESTFWGTSFDLTQIHIPWKLSYRITWIASAGPPRSSTSPWWKYWWTWISEVSSRHEGYPIYPFNGHSNGKKLTDKYYRNLKTTFAGWGCLVFNIEVPQSFVAIAQFCGRSSLHQNSVGGIDSPSRNPRPDGLGWPENPPFVYTYIDRYPFVTQIIIFYFSHENHENRTSVLASLATRLAGELLRSCIIMERICSPSFGGVPLYQWWWNSETPILLGNWHNSLVIHQLSNMIIWFFHNSLFLSVAQTFGLREVKWMLSSMCPLHSFQFFWKLWLIWA